jgi:tetratricopeptide (TPR) repeat protein
MDDRHYASATIESLDSPDYLAGSTTESSSERTSHLNDSTPAQPAADHAVKPRKRVILLPKLTTSKPALEIESEPPALGFLSSESEDFQRTVTVIPSESVPELPTPEPVVSGSVSQASLAALESANGGALAQASDRSQPNSAAKAAQKAEPKSASSTKSELAKTSDEALFWKYLRQGNALFQSGKTEEAIAAYHQALQFNAESVEVYQHLAQSLSQQGNLAEAASYYRKAIELTSEEVRQRVMPAAAVEEPQAEDPLPWYEEAAFYLQQGKAHYQRQDWDAAIAACEQAVQLLGPKSAEAFHILGQALQEKGQFERAKQSYQQALNLQPQAAEFYAHMASVHAQQQQLQDAIGYYQKAIELNPNYAAAYWEMGEVWRKLGNRDQASDAWYRALQLEPSWANAKEHWRLGTALTEQNKFAQAIHCYEQAVHLDPNFAEAYHNLGVVLGKQGKWQEALQYHRRAATLKPNNPQFWAGQGRTLIALENWNEAIACYQKVTGLNLNNSQGYTVFQHALAQIEQCQKALVAQSYYNMAEKLTQHQQWQEATTCYQQAIQRYPNQAQYYASLGKALAALDRWAESIEAYQKAMELAPEQTEYTLAFGDVLIRREQLQKHRRLQAASSTDNQVEPLIPTEVLKENKKTEQADTNLFTLL